MSVVWRQVMFGALVACVVGVSPANAQLLTQHIKGPTGLKAGSQPPPHVYIPVLLYQYQTDEVRNRDGDRLLPSRPDAELTSRAYGTGIFVVTNKKFLGANYGFQVLFPVGANNRIQGTEIDANPGAGITDSVVQPVSLGWHLPRADALFGYAIYVPTGRYEDGASDNTGFGMWGHEISFGTTVYLNEAKKYHAATMVSFNFQSQKEDSTTKVGNAVNLEGGVGADFLMGGLSAGLVYYASFKLQQDHIQGFPDILIRGKNKVFALGPEVSLALARKGTVYGFVKVNYQWETYARTNTLGGALSILATFLAPPIKLPTP
jgi:hypothetical protein